MVLNRMSKGAKEIDIAATLEHIRDQRMHMAKTKVRSFLYLLQNQHNIFKHFLTFFFFFFFFFLKNYG